MTIAVRPRFAAPLPALLLALALAATGCGSGSDSEGSDAPSGGDKTSSAPEAQKLTQLSMGTGDLAPEQLELSKQEEQATIDEAAAPNTVYANVARPALEAAGFAEGLSREFGSIYDETKRKLNFASFRIKRYEKAAGIDAVMQAEIASMQQAYPRAGGKLSPVSQQAGLGEKAVRLTSVYPFGESHNLVWRNGNDVYVLNCIWGNDSLDMPARTLAIAKKVDAKRN